jgi:hypothetical protein
MRFLEQKWGYDRRRNTGWILTRPRSTLLGRLARDERFPGTGSLLLTDALTRALGQSTQIASMAVVAQAKDAAALGFYRRFGFAPLGNAPNRVFIAMGTIEELLRIESMSPT